jgi:alkylation response protein AidB-like acyl-CoA dehydrogenase
MDLEYSPEEIAFRDEVRAWIRANLPPDLKEKVEGLAELSKEDVMRWHRILARQGWIAPHWPQEWGGTGWNVVQRYLFEEECGLAGAPQLPALSLVFCAPVLIRYGTEAQKKRFLPAIYSGDEFWCQGYSEPGSGSDLASLKTAAVRDGDHYIVTGQKTWTTSAHWADWMFCLVRTGGPGTKPQDSVSFLLIDMRSPGIEVRPLLLMDGAHEVNEVFLDRVKVPVGNRVHEEGKGWTVAKFLLGYERLNNARVGIAKRTMASLKRLASQQEASGKPLIDEPRFHDRLSRVEVELMALEITNLRYLDRLRRTGVPPGAEASILKIKGSEIHQALSELMLQAAGLDAAGPVASRYLNLRKLSIYGGTNEIQRNIIAKASLGL